MNILSFDIEEWYIEKYNFGNRSEKFKSYDLVLDQVLNILDESKTKATFFCLGGIANDFPYVIKKIKERGHEIGSHSNKHLWLTKMSEHELREDTRCSIDSIEQLIGEKVLSYRAPAFSIGEKNKWVLGVLADLGIERDSSIFPAKRDFGGFPTFNYSKPTIISYQGIQIKEFPISLSNFFGKDIVYCGGGYFRFFPLSFIQNQMNRNDYTMSYFHIEDFLVEKVNFNTKIEYENYFKESGSFYNRYKRFIKSNIGKKGALSKITSLINSANFINLEAADKVIDWEILHL